MNFPLKLKQHISKSSSDTPISELRLYDYFGGLATRLKNILEREKIKTIGELVARIDKLKSLSTVSIKALIPALGERGEGVLLGIYKIYKKDE